MFTGLIEDIGTLAERHIGGESAALTVTTALPMTELKLGDSIAVDGACLTVTGFGDGRFTADVSRETLERTTLGRAASGARLNLERALRLSDRLGGHLVTGHVDGVGRLAEKTRQGNAWRLVFQCPDPLMPLLVEKGSVAVDGISLTVNAVNENRISLTVIPHTLERTTLQDRRIGDEVNLETDLIGKYVARLLACGDQAKSGGVNLELLAKHGFL